MKEVLTLIGIGPATETVARALGTDRQLVLADLQVASHATPEDSSGDASRPASAAEDLAKILRRAGIKSRSTQVDLSDAESVEALIQYAERLGKPAGPGCDRPHAAAAAAPGPQRGRSGTAIIQHTASSGPPDRCRPCQPAGPASCQPAPARLGQRPEGPYRLLLAQRQYRNPRLAHPEIHERRRGRAEAADALPA